MSKTYLVTGGAGFIGSNFIRYMLREHGDIFVINVDKLTYAGNLANVADVASDDRYRFVRADICDKEAMGTLFGEYDIDAVINFAAESHVDRSIASPGIFVSTNVGGTVNLLDCARSAWENGDGSYLPGKKFLQVSTDEVYGTLSLENRGEFFTEDMALEPNSPYSASKAAADLFVLSYGATYGLPVNITRCSNNYGPYQHPEKLIPHMILNAVAHRPLPVYGDGQNVRDWLFVDDHCRAIDLVLNNAAPGEIYNVGGHNERSNIEVVSQLVAMCSRYLGDEGINTELIEYVEDRKGHDRRYGIAPDKIAEDLGWQPEVLFREGIESTTKWYLENLAWVQHVAGFDDLRNNCVD